MTALVLQSRSQILEARSILESRNLAWRTPPLSKLLRRLRLLRTQQIGDEIKAWDVLQTVEFASQHLTREQPVLDIGAFASEIPIALHRAGFTDVSGVDLNPAVKAMPYADKIRYSVGNFMATPFEDASFSLVTAISVIEHGFRSRDLFSEVSRLLKPGGYFVASFDYWPDKIGTEGIEMFGMDWRIFSRAEVEEMIADARGHGLEPQGPIDLSARERPIHFFDRAYTFAWLALRKKGGSSTRS